MNKYEGENLIFIVGCPRSGTTWLQKLLSSHPKVYTGQESGIFDSYIGPQLKAWYRDLDPVTSGRDAIGLCCYFQEEEFMKIMREYMMNLLSPMVSSLKKDEFFLEKTPGHSLYVREILMMLPKCKIIHIVRHPKSVVASLLAASKSWGSYWAPRNAYSATKMWLTYVLNIKKSCEDLPPAQFIEIRYEDLYINPYSIVSNLISFLEIDWNKYDINEAIVANSFANIRKSGGTNIFISGEAFKQGKINKLSDPVDFVRKADLNAWKNELSLFDKLLVNFLTPHDVLSQFGYCSDKYL